MKFKTWTMWALLAAAGVAINGCSEGSRGGGNGLVGSSVGDISSAMPAIDRDPTGYEFPAYFTPSSVPGGSVTALAVAPVGTAVLAADSPFSNVTHVDDGQATFEGSLYFDATSFAQANGDTVLATASRNAPGAGDIWARDDASGSWNLIHDTNENEAVVAAVGTATYAAVGSIGGSTAISIRTGNTFQEIASIVSQVPTAAIGFRGELWVAVTDSLQAEQGAASLHHGAGTTFLETRPMPIPAVGAGVRQEVTDMVTIAGVNSGTTVELLAVAVAEFDINGEAVSGRVVLTDGDEFEVLNTWEDDAPTALAFVDDALYAGTQDGLLQYRDDEGEWVDEEGLSRSYPIASLLVNGNDLVVGTSSPTGAQVLLRELAGSTTPTPTPTPTPSGDVFYVDDVAPLLASSCAACHNGALPTASAAWPLTNPADNMADFNELMTRVDTADPDASLLLLKAAGDSSVGGHGGGQLFAAGSSEHDTIRDWIAQGARFEDVTAPPPPPPPPPPPARTFAGDVQPLLQADCMGCHAGGAGGFTINGGAGDFQNAVARVNSNNPQASLLLTKPALDGVAHAGGTPTGWAKGAGKYNAVEEWIQDGTQP